MNAPSNLKHRMKPERHHQLTPASMALRDALDEYRDVITWASAFCDVLEATCAIYGVYSEINDAPDILWILQETLKELEQYLVLDIMRRLAVSDGRTPYYLSWVSSHIGLIQRLLGDCVPAGKRVFAGAAADLKECEHLVAELQATCLEHGFCETLEPLTDLVEITHRLETLSVNLLDTEASVMADPDSEASLLLAVCDMQEGLALQKGIQQAATKDNIGKVSKIFDRITATLSRLDNNICKKNIQKGSTLITTYANHQREMSSNIACEGLFSPDRTLAINAHTLHPGTRAWLLDTISKWHRNSRRSIFVLSGKQGTGKTAFAAHICKLYGSAVVASHFFSPCLGRTHNSVVGVIQSVAAELCQALPEYGRWLAGKFNAGLPSELNGHWQKAYNALLNIPLNELYRCNGRPLHRRIIVIDGLDEMDEVEWADMKAFLTAWKTDLPQAVCILTTVRAKHFQHFIPHDLDRVDGVRFEDRTWLNAHIKDIEVYISCGLGAILSGEGDVSAPTHAKADEATLQSTVDELVKSSAGRFDYALEVMSSFCGAMTTSRGQFLSSLKRALGPVRQKHAAEFENRKTDFSSPFRSYRDKEGRSVAVRVMRQSLYPMDRTRVALIRGRQAHASQ